MNLGPFKRVDAVFIGVCISEGTMPEGTLDAAISSVPWSDDTLTLCFTAEGLSVIRHNDGVVIDTHIFSGEPNA